MTANRRDLLRTVVVVCGAGFGLVTGTWAIAYNLGRSQAEVLAARVEFNRVGLERTAAIVDRNTLDITRLKVDVAGMGKQLDSLEDGQRRILEKIE